MVTPIDAVRFHSNLSEAGSRLRTEERFRSSEQEEELIAPMRGAIVGLPLSVVLWVGLIVAGRAILGL